MAGGVGERLLSIVGRSLTRSLRDRGVCLAKRRGVVVRVKLLFVVGGCATGGCGGSCGRFNHIRCGSFCRLQHLEATTTAAVPSRVSRVGLVNLLDWPVDTQLAWS